MQVNMASATDVYKIGHGPMYHEGTEEVLANLTPRTDKIHRRNCTAFYDGHLVWVGGQGAVQELHENWERSFFSQPKEKVISRYRRRVMGVVGSEVVTVEQMAKLHDLGYLPLEFASLPEGMLVPMGIPVLTIRNTLPEFFWLTNYHETPLSSLTWKTATNATISREYRLICEHYARLTGCYDAFAISVQCHDFSLRGMSGIEDGARSGFGHLCNFIGTDNVPSVDYAEDYYGHSAAGISVPATEHAVTSNNIITIEGKLLRDEYKFANHEQKTIYVEMMNNAEDIRLIAEVMFVYELIKVKFPAGIVSSVQDTYDFWGMITRGYKYLKEAILSRPAAGMIPGKLVCRPDSGDPVQVVCGMLPVCGDDGKAIDFASEDAAYDWLETGDRIRQVHGADCIKIAGVFYEYSSTVYDDYTEGCGIDMDITYDYEVVAGALRTLWKVFGGEVNDAGYKVLHPSIGLIYGDSITTKRAEEILRRMEAMGFASTNIVFGVGSYTYQCNTRDTFGFAVKATNSVVDGEEVAIFKAPKTDVKKHSAKGRLAVFLGEGGKPELIDNATQAQVDSKYNLLKPFYCDGVWLRRTTLDEIRTRLS